MKTGLFTLVAVSALQLAAAQPHRIQALMAREDIIYTTVLGPEVIVYVYPDGQPVKTSTVGAAAVAAPTAAAIENDPAKPSIPAAAPAPAPAPARHDSSSGSSGETPSGGYGIAYSPYNNDGSCKSQSQVDGDFAQNMGSYGTVRIYGTDCNQASTVLQAAKNHGMKVFAGVFDIDQVTSETQTLIDAAQGDWSAIAAVSVGNELVNDGEASVSAVVSAVNSARAQLRAAGYSGPVVTVDTFVALIANPELCDASDFAAANAHAFYDGGVTAPDAGQFVAEQQQRVKAACGGKHTVITESGWPSSGATNGAAVPSEANQQAAISSLRAAFAADMQNLVLFTAYNNLWEQNTADTFDTEQAWGIYGDSST